jgi:mono/diheme cytochrome c family protein
MPAMGRAQLTPDQVSAVAAYVWSLSHWAVRGSGKHVDHP